MAHKYSKQRQAIWSYIKDRKDHPTADAIYEAVRSEYPNISLGTVYRNLLFLKDAGKLRTVQVDDGVVHFDPDITEHDHFICKGCGSVLDITGTDPVRMKALVTTGFTGRIDGYSAFFYGLCPACVREYRNLHPEEEKASVS